ncbi:MAG TPA: hypothetical protein VD932_01080 [Aquabacterium sp.]|nr:hypothetical protein [Aquabacterium sp.]
MTPGASRARLCRQRQKLGLRIYKLELDDAAIEDALIAAGRLSDEDAADHAAKECALEQLLLDVLKRRNA